MKNLLITGIKSGLGWFIYENIGESDGLTRNNYREVISNSYNTIIHCAFNSSKKYQGLELANYIEDNILLTKTLLNLTIQKFIYISSIDVYSRDMKLFTEDARIDIDKIENIYGISKYISESFIQKYSTNFLILRASALLGQYSRHNSLIKMIKNKKCTLSLSSNSVFNYILYEDILSFIKYAITNDVKGIYNIASKDNIFLSEAKKIVQEEKGSRKVKFGNYLYQCGEIDISKITKTGGYIPKKTVEVVKYFIKKIN